MPPDTRAWIPGYYFYYSYKDAKTQRGSQSRKDHNPDASPGFRFGIVSPEKSVCINNENQLN